MGRTRILIAFILGLANTDLGRAKAEDRPAPKPIEVKLAAIKSPVSYAGQVVDILENRCTGCHGSALAEKKLSLESVPAMIKGGKGGPALVPGKADESLMFKMAAHRVEPVMPPKDKPGNSPMTPDELGVLKVWIDAGAKDDSAEHVGEKPKDSVPIELGELPPGVQPVNAIDMTADGRILAAGRANVVQVFDIDSGAEMVRLGGHKDLIQSVRFSPDGSLLAAGSYQMVTLWKSPEITTLGSLRGHQGPAQSLAVAPDRRRAYSGGQDGTIRVWDLATVKPGSVPGAGAVIKQPAPVTALMVSADGKTLVTGGGDGVVRLIAADGKERAVWKGHSAAVRALAWLPGQGGGLRLVSASDDGTARVWTDVTPKGSTTVREKVAEKSAEPRVLVLHGHKGLVHAVVATGDGRQIITGGQDGSVRLWSGEDGSPKGLLKTGHAGAILALAISPDGKTLATGSADKTARLLHLGQEGDARILARHGGAVHAVAFVSGGRRVWSAGADRWIWMWDVATGEELLALSHRGDAAKPQQPVLAVATVGDNGLVSASADGSLMAWKVTGSWSRVAVLGPHVSRVLALDFSPDGKLLAAGGGDPSRSGEIKIWSVPDAKLVRSFDSLHSDTVFSLRFSPDGKKLASGAADKFLKVSSVSDGKELRSFEGHTHHVMAVDWKADGKQLITGGADKVLKLWDFESGEQVRTLQEVGKQITGVRWVSGKPEVVSTSGDAQVRSWNPDSGGVVRNFGGPSDYVLCVSASQDGSRIAAGAEDGVIWVWDGKGGQVLRKFDPQPARPSAAAR